MPQGKCSTAFLTTVVSHSRWPPIATTSRASTCRRPPSKSPVASQQLNGITNAHFREGNTFDLLKEYDEVGRQFDTIILDPPAFAKNRDSIPAAQRGYKEINLRALKLLKPGGFLITCSCSYHISGAALPPDHR